MERPGSVRLSLLFSFTEKYVLLLLGTAGAMILSRLLTPADIGIFSVGAVLTGLAQVVRDFGVGQFIIQEKDLCDAKLRAALSTSLLVAWLLAAAVLLASAPAARFYHEPRVGIVMRLLSINFLLIPFSSVTLPYLRRQLRFAAILAVNCAHSVAQFTCSIGLALLGFGYLSLAWAAVAGTVAALLTSLWLRPRELPWLPARRGVRQILRFGMYSTAGGVVDELGVGAPDMVIGRMIGLAEVGVFGKALGVLGIFNQLITSAVSPVIFPMFSARVRDGQDLQQAYLATAGHMAALAWPFFGFVALTAPALLQLLYGPQWAAAVPLIRIMCLSSALYSIFSMARYLFVAMGHVRAQARLDAIAVPVRVVALVVAAPFGLEALAWAVVLGALFRSWLTYLFLVRLVRLKFAALLWAMRHSAMVALAGVAGAVLGQWCLPTGAGGLLSLAAAALLAAMSWLAALFWTKHALAAECALVGRRLLGLPV